MHTEFALTGYDMLAINRDQRSLPEALDMSRSRTLIRRSGASYLIRLKKRDVDRTLAFLLFWFVWSQRNELAGLFQGLAGVFA
jgi:hypothetical protein